MLRGAFVHICVGFQLEEQIQDIHKEKDLTDISNRCIEDEARRITTLVPLLTLSTAASAVDKLLNDAWKAV
jgi:hypothetical protein